MNPVVLLRSLALKGVMLGVAVAALVWVEWPVPDRPMEAAQGITIQGPLSRPSSVATRPIQQPERTKIPVPPSAPDRSRLDLNGASREDLRSLPGIGPVLSMRILDRRTSRGGFRTVEELLDVRGIGEGRLKRIRPYVTVGQAAVLPREQS